MLDTQKAKKKPKIEASADQSTKTDNPQNRSDSDPKKLHRFYLTVTLL